MESIREEGKGYTAAAYILTSCNRKLVGGVWSVHQDVQSVERILQKHAGGAPVQPAESGAAAQVVEGRGLGGTF